MLEVGGKGSQSLSQHKYEKYFNNNFRTTTFQCDKISILWNLKVVEWNIKRRFPALHFISALNNLTGSLSLSLNLSPVSIIMPRKYLNEETYHRYKRINHKSR